MSNILSDKSVKLISELFNKREIQVPMTSVKDVYFAQEEIKALIKEREREKEESEESPS